MTLASVPLDRRYRSAMSAGAAVCLAMFVGESWIGLRIGSAALIAGAANFLEQASYCGLAVLAAAWAAPAKARAGAALGWAMAVIGLLGLCQVALRLVRGGRPGVEPMALTAAAALAVNFYCACRPAPHRQRGAGWIAIWLSVRDDLTLNILVIAAAGAIAIAATGWPDIVAGLIIAGVNIKAAIPIVRYWRRASRASN